MFKDKRFLIIIVFFFLSCLEPPLHRDRFVVLGSYLEVISPDKEAAGIVYQEFRRLDLIFNKNDSRSELYRVNNNPGQKVNVSEEMIDLILKAKRYYQLTDGAFDLSKGKLYNFWKQWLQGSEIDKFPEKEKIKNLQKAGDILDIEVDAEAGRVLVKEGVLIDLSGVAKGYIVDRAVTKLKKSGITNALINAGGDIYCLGDNRGQPWLVGIRDPLGKVVETVALSNKGVATSGNYQQFYQRDDKFYSHIIDPRVGYPVEREFLGVTVIASSSWEADLLATVFFINGKSFTKKFLKKNPSISVYFVSKEKTYFLE